jgi:hypothetical protein
MQVKDLLLAATKRHASPNREVHFLICFKKNNKLLTKHNHNDMKKRIITYSVMFIVLFLVRFFLTMLTGVSTRPVLGKTYKSLSFRETLDELPTILGITLITLALGIFAMEKMRKKGG